MIVRALSIFRWYVVNMAYWVTQRGHVGKGQVVYFDLRANLWHRYLHSLIQFFEICGYTVHVRHRWRFIGSWASGELFKKTGTFLIRFSKPPEGTCLRITDRSMIGHITLDPDYHKLPGEELTGMRLPMPMMYSVYLNGVHKNMVIDAAALRSRALFFFGNMDREAYTRDEVQDVFGCFNRMHLLDTIRAHFPHRVHAPRTAEEVIVADGRDILLTDRSDFYIHPKVLMTVLARFDFFLAPSGVTMPLCHNVVEAMCAGCIPVLQHAHLMEPPLQHGEDCLSFHDEESLIAVLEQLPRMDTAVVRTMRKKVLAYYKEHLTPEAVITKMEQEAVASGILRVNAELRSTQLLRKKLDAAGINGPLPRI